MRLVLWPAEVDDRMEEVESTFSDLNVYDYVRLQVDARMDKPFASVAARVKAALAR